MIGKMRIAITGILRIAMLLASFLYFEPVLATSCVPMRLAYYGYCDKSGCTKGFVVEEVRTYIICGRRKEVRDIDPWALEVMSEYVRANDTIPGSKLVQLSAGVRFWGRFKAPSSRAEYDAQLTDDLYWSFRKPHVSILSGPASPDDLSRFRRSEESIATSQLWADRAWRIADWLGLFAALIVVGWSVARYRGLVYAGQKRGRTGPLMIQVAIFAIDFYMIAAVSMPLFVLTGPIILLLVWSYQIAFSSYLRLRHRKQPLVPSI